MRVSTRPKLENALLGTGFCFRHSQEYKDAYLNALKELLPVCSDIRRAGAATLDLAYVACGRFEGFWN